MSIISSAFILITGIGLLVILQFYRAVLSLHFPEISTRLLPEPIRALSGTDDLYRQATQTLSNLGFSEPVWLLNDDVHESTPIVRKHAIFRSSENTMAIWMAPPVDLSTPNRLLTYITTKLNNDKWVVTQVEDPYFELLKDEMTPSQTVAATDFSSLIEQHQQFVEQHHNQQGSQQITNAQLIEFASTWQNRIRQELINTGTLRLNKGIAQPGLFFGLSILWRLLTRPKTPSDPKEPVPVSRLALLSRTLELTKKRAPSQAIQLWLMLFSVLLSLMIGWPILGLQFTIIILGVIIFHEFGHWCAMRAFGYDNPHITLLPLLGGVAMGHETDPSPSKRAWVSLAGPLPGILLGWSLLLVLGLSHFSGIDQGGWISLTAIILLAINYLNILPIPPLDGHHVIRALLPGHSAVLQALCIVLGIVLGTAFGIYMGFWVIVLLALLQLFLLKQIWSNAKAARLFCNEQQPESHHHHVRMNWILEKMQQQFGAANPRARISQAQEVLNLMQMRPMDGWQRMLITTVYLILLVVPIGAGIALLKFNGAFHNEADYEQMIADQQKLLAAYQAKADPMSVANLIDDITQTQPSDSGASNEELKLVESRLGKPLTENIQAFYSRSDGLVEQGITRLSRIKPIAESELAISLIQNDTWQDNYYLQFYGSEDTGKITTTELTKIALDRFWLLSEPQNEFPIYLYDSLGTPELRSFTFLVLNPGYIHVYPGIDDWLRESWVEQEIADEYRQKFEESHKRALDALQNAGIQDLLDEFDQPSWWLRLINKDLAWPHGASEIQLTTLEQQLMLKLPQDHRQILSQFNGFPPIGLLATDRISRINDQQMGHLQEMTSTPFNEFGNAELVSVSSSQLVECWVIGGRFISAYEDYPEQATADLLWCPHIRDTGVYLDPHQKLAYNKLSDVLRNTAARLNSTQYW